MQQLGTAAQNLKPERRHLVSDLIAGLTFAVVNVPQAMAHALLTAVGSPVLGIYTLMVAVPVGAIFTSSVYMNVSTTSALSVAAGAGLANIPSNQKVQAMVVLVLFPTAGTSMSASQEKASALRSMVKWLLSCSLAVAQPKVTVRSRSDFALK